MSEIKPFDNHLGIVGWLGGGRWGVERYLYIIHRVAGLGILLFFMAHIFESSVRIFGPQSWNAAMAVLDHPVFKFGEFVLYVGFAFHALNGLRLILIELGFAVGKAEEPVYPYRSSLNVQRPLMIATMIVAAVFILAGGMNIFILH
jgi:succinate dehydrogenase / fumarate reductase cytochrome b subunit